MVIVARLGPFEEEETGIGAATGSNVVKVMGKGGRVATECMSVAKPPRSTRQSQYGFV